MQYIIYCRKSSESEDRQVMSLDAQEQELLKIAEQSGLEVISTLRESMSAKNPGRPVFAQMLNLLSKGKADGILCWKLDRLARNPIDGGNISWLLQQGTIKNIKTPQRDYYPHDNVLMMSVEFGMSNQYIRDLSENVKRGNREKLRRGEWPNHAPFGYLNDKLTKTVKPDPKNAKYVIEMFELYATGSYSYRDIADILYKQGLRTKNAKRVQKSLVENVVKKTFYFGMMERDGVFYPGNHKPLISKELFEKAKYVREEASRPRPKTLFFPYRGFMKCEICECALTATRKKQKYDYYYCTNGKFVCSQHKRYLNEEAVEKLFLQAFHKIAFDETLVDIMYQAAQQRTGLDAERSKNVIKKFETDIEDLHAQEKKLLRKSMADLISEELYQEEAKRLQNEIKILEKQKKDFMKKSKHKAVTLEPIKEIFLEGSKAISEFHQLKNEEKRKAVENILWNLSIEDGKVAQYKFKSPYDVLAKAPKNGDLETMLPDRDSNPD